MEIKQIKRNFSVDVIEKFVDDDDPEFAYGTTLFLSTRPNTHGLVISEEVLRNCADTIKGKWLVCKVNPYTKDGEGHMVDECISGRIPENQDIRFEYDKDGYLLAICDFVISKIYAEDVYNMFKYNDNRRSVSVEMLTVGTELENGEVDNNLISNFCIVGLTVLGKRINPSSPGANAKLVKFEEKANKFYENCKSNSLSELKKFVKERRVNMEKKTYKVDKSKDSMVDTPWGNVDKTELYKKIIDASNADTLVKDVYMKVENGWKDAPSDKLKYPVMQFKGDTLVYNRNGLSSALGYARAENETDVVSKIEKIYKSLDIEDDNDNKESKGKESKTMQEQKFEIEGRKAWGDVIAKVQDHEGKDVYVDSVEKDHIIYTKGDERYRVEADVKVGEDDKKVSADIKWNTVKKDKVQKMEEKTDDKNKKDDKAITMSDCVDFIKKLSTDANVDASAYCEMLEEEARKNEKLAKDLEERDNIIMQKDTELGELKKFKEDTEKKSIEMEVAKTLEEVKNFVEKDDFEKFESEGKLCKMSELDGWKNKVKSVAFEASKKSNKQRQGLWRMGAPVEGSKNTGLWAD